MQMLFIFLFGSLLKNPGVRSPAHNVQSYSHIKICILYHNYLLECPMSKTKLAPSPLSNSALYLKATFPCKKSRKNRLPINTFYCQSDPLAFAFIPQGRSWLNANAVYGCMFLNIMCWISKTEYVWKHAMIRTTNCWSIYWWLLRQYNRVLHIARQKQTGHVQTLDW